MPDAAQINAYRPIGHGRGQRSPLRVFDAGKVTLLEVCRKGWRIAAIYSNATTDVTARVERIILIERLD